MLDVISSKTIYLIGMSIVIMFLGWFLSKISLGKMKSITVDQSCYYEYFNSKHRDRKVKQVFFIWLAFTFAEILVYKNVPLISALGVGPYVRYSHFGFPGIHGFLNALYFSLLSYYFLKAIVLGEKRYYIVVLLYLFWPFLALSRMMIMASIIQLFFLAMIASPKMSSTRIIKFSILFILVIMLFGIMGDIRNGREHLLGVAQLTFEYPEWLPSGFAWVYLYLTTPLNNINFAIEQYLEPSSFPIELGLRIFPSFLREPIYEMAGRVDDTLFVSNAFNISTLFLPMIKDFGWILTPFVFFPIGFMAYFVVLKSIRNPRYVVLWSVLLYSIVISVFSNHMFHLVFWSQAIFSFFIFGKKNV